MLSCFSHVRLFVAYGLKSARPLCPWDSPLEWIAISTSRGSSLSRNPTCIFYVCLLWQVGSLLPAPSGSPLYTPAAATAKSLQSCPTLCDPINGSPLGSPSLGFSKKEHWSGLPFPSPMHESEKWKWSEVTQSCPTLSDPMDCSSPGSSVHGIFQARVLEWVPLPSLLYTPSACQKEDDGKLWMSKFSEWVSKWRKILPQPPWRSIIFYENNFIQSI